MVFYFLTNLLLFCFQANVWLYKKIRWITFFILFIFFELCNITWIYFTPLEALKHPWKAMISKRHFWQNLRKVSSFIAIPFIILFLFATSSFSSTKWQRCDDGGLPVVYMFSQCTPACNDWCSSMEWIC